MERFELFRALTGSHNYNLNRPDSDRDYKVFIVPGLDDLYYKNDAKEKAKHGVEEDYDYHDIRNFVYRMSRSNVNFIEVLFSEEIVIDKDLPVWAKYAVSQLMSMKHDIARMNLPYLYDACLGMKFNKMKLLDNGSISSQQFVSKHGYDTKSAMNAYRILDFLERFAETDFKDFKSAIWYRDSEKVMLNSILNGEFSKDEVVRLIEGKELRIASLYKDIYKSKSVDTELEQTITKVIKDLIKHSIVLKK